MKRPRDYQRSKVYAAERDTDYWKPYHWDSWHKAAAFAQSVLIDPWVFKRIPYLPIVQTRRGSVAWANIDIVSLPPWAYFPMVIVHEISHNVCLHAYGRAISHHGPEFAAVYCHLVGIHVNKRAQNQLKREFRWRNVHFEVDNLPPEGIFRV